MARGKTACHQWLGLVPGSLAATALAVLACCTACSFRPATPRDFAAYPRSWPFSPWDQSRDRDFRAVSPDGVVFNVRTEKNKPQAGLDFWREAMKSRMRNAGYRVVADTACATGGAEGALLKLSAPWGDRDFLYWIALSLSPSQKEIMVIEAAGESKSFLAREADVRRAISGTRW